MQNIRGIVLLTITTNKKINILKEKSVVVMKKVIVACGGAVATSTVAANKIRELAKKEGIAVEVTQCRVNELESKKDGIDLIVTTAKVTKDYGVPVVHGVAFVSGINIAATEQKILEILRQ
jgi:PTS system galactitol-specific IIB component